MRKSFIMDVNPCLVSQNQLLQSPTMIKMLKINLISNKLKIHRSIAVLSRIKILMSLNYKPQTPITTEIGLKDLYYYKFLILEQILEFLTREEIQSSIMVQISIICHGKTKY